MQELVEGGGITFWSFPSIKTAQSRRRGDVPLRGSTDSVSVWSLSCRALIVRGESIVEG